MNGILDNPLVQKDLPAEAVEFASYVSFDGSDAPSLPINWKFAESISALKAYEATILNVLLTRKYGIGPAKININTYVLVEEIMSAACKLTYKPT